MQPLDPIPENDPLTDQTQHMNSGWYRWLFLLVSRLLSAVQSIPTPLHRVGVAAAISATTLFTPAFKGAYRVSWNLQITTAATTSSSATVTLRWKTNSVAQAKSWPAITGNTTTTNDSQTFTIYPDIGQTVTIEVAYATVGGVPMAYAFDAVPEELT